MSTAELKTDLINRIANTEEPGIIEELRKLLDLELNNEILQTQSSAASKTQRGKIRRFFRECNL